MSAVVFPGLAHPHAGIPPVPVYRLSVSQYEGMIAAGVLRDGDPVELIDGWLVPKVTKNPPHILAAEAIREELVRIFGRGWTPRSEAPVTLRRSVPELDLVMARGTRQDYAKRHPGPADIALLVEVAEATLGQDRGWKKRAYASEGIECYWLINLIDRQIEVYTGPNRDTVSPDYPPPEIYRAGDEVPVALEGKQIGAVAVSDVLPPE